MINTLDLNLLRVFDALLQEGSVSRAGVRLGLSQSAVSHALNRLRQTVGDDLFRRGPSGMQPTARALEIGPSIHAALVQVQAALSPAHFDPTVAERRFTIVAGPYTCTVLVPELIARMRERAPRADLRITSFAWDAIDSLEIGRADMAIGSFEGVAERHSYRKLFAENLVWVVRAGHPLAESGAAPSVEALASVEHVSIEYPKPDASPAGDRRLRRHSTLEDHGAFERELRQRGLQRRVGVAVPDSYTALAVVSRSDMAALAPRRLAERAVQNGALRLLEPPYESPPIEIGILYMRERASDPAQIWLLDLLIESARNL